MYYLSEFYGIEYHIYGMVLPLKVRLSKVKSIKI